MIIAKIFLSFDSDIIKTPEPLLISLAYYIDSHLHSGAGLSVTPSISWIVINVY